MWHQVDRIQATWAAWGNSRVRIIGELLTCIVIHLLLPNQKEWWCCCNSGTAAKVQDELKMKIIPPSFEIYQSCLKQLIMPKKYRKLFQMKQRIFMTWTGWDTVSLRFKRQDLKLFIFTYWLIQIPDWEKKCADFSISELKHTIHFDVMFSIFSSQLQHVKTCFNDVINTTNDITGPYFLYWIFFVLICYLKYVIWCNRCSVWLTDLMSLISFVFSHILLHKNTPPLGKQSVTKNHWYDWFIMLKNMNLLWLPNKQMVTL